MGSNGSVSTLWKLLLGGVLGIVASIGVVAAVSSVFHPVGAASIDLAEGGQIFNQKCSGCHAITGDGQTKFGPSLKSIGEHSPTGSGAQNAAEYILQSIIHPDQYRKAGVEGHMPSGTTSGLSVKGVRNLVAFLSGQGNAINYDHIMALDIDAKDLANQELDVRQSAAKINDGWQLFSTKFGCIGCHSILGEPGSDLVAPALHQASQLSPEYVVESITDPSRIIVRSYRNASVMMKDGTSYNGRLIDNSEDVITLYGRNSNGLVDKIELNTADIDKTTISDTSTMPAYRLTAEDEEALLAFFAFLNAEVH